MGRAGALCVSSQVGCTLNCTFCHTGTQALVRNLTAAEIVAQVQVARDDLEEWPSPKEDRQLTNIVFMGMGEPLYNLDNVATAIDIITDNEGIAHLAPADHRLDLRRRAANCRRWARRPSAMLAISLHATNDELREILVPLNKKYPLAELMAGIRAYPGLSNASRVTFEYVMLKGVNDSPAEAKALVQLLKGIPAKINLIPFNPWPGSGYECSSWSTIEAFAAILNRGGYASPIRTPRGRDILAACGQLKSESEKLRASARPSSGRDAGGQASLPGEPSFVLTLRRASSGTERMPTPSPEIQAFAAGFPVFLAHSGVTVAILILAAALYVLLTPHKEITLIREGNTAAALSLGGVLVGLAIPLAASLNASTNVIEIGLWGAVTVVVQLLVFRLVDLILRGLPKRIQDGEISAAALLVGAKLATALVIAAARS